MSQEVAPARPVFVDDSGRRHRVVRVVGWVVGSLVVAYLVLLGVSLVASPNLLPLSLPSVGRLLPGPGAPLVHEPRQGPPTPPPPVAGTAPSHVSAPAAAAGPRLTPAPVSGRAGSTLPAAGRGPSRVSTSAAPTGGRASTPAVAPAPSATVSAPPKPSATHTPQGNPSPHGSPRPTHSPKPRATHRGSP